MARNDDFINLSTALNHDMPATRTQARDHAGVRAAIEDQITRARDARIGGTLYLPPVEGGQFWVDVSGGALVIPPEFTLLIAPGVVLVPVTRAPTDNAHIDVRGPFDAPIGHALATDAWFARHGGAEAGLRAGTIRFSSRRMERVHPEWWGALAEPTVGDDDALDAALRAAVRDRVTGGGPLAPLEIELRATYRLTRPWTLVDVAGAPAVTLRGMPAADGVPTLVCAPSFPGGAMVIARDLESLTLEDVRFDGQMRASSCVSLTRTRQSALERPHLLRRCGFAGATGALVETQATAAGEIAPLADEVGGARTVDLRAEGCRFAPVARSQTALRVSGPPNVGVELEGCRFEGAAAAMVHARGCALSLVSCHFHNRVPEVVTTPEAELHARGPEGDLDVFLDAVATGPVASVYAQDCRSRSEQFLATVRLDAAPPCADSTVIGLHHVHPQARSAFERVLEVPPPKRLPPIWEVFEPTPLTPKVVGPTVLTPNVSAPKGIAPDALQKAVAAPSPRVVGFPAEARFEEIPKGGTYALPPGVKFGPDAGDTTTIRAAGNGVAPILWRVPSASGARLVLMGCRFDRLGALPAVRALGPHAPVANLGILGATTPITADVSAAVQEVPLLSTG